MLETSLFESDGRGRTRKPLTVLISVIVHALVIVTLILVPLTHPQVVPALSAATGLPIPIVSPEEHHKDSSPAPEPAFQPQIRPSPADFISPATIPADIALLTDESAAAVSPVASGSSGGIRTLLQSLVNTDTVGSEPDPPPPPPIAPPTVIAPIRVGSILQANLVHRVVPVYPPLAKQARVQGAVVLEATIDKDGTIRDLRLISGHPLLVEAALNAVQQWRYKPTILNGDPVEVITTVTVTFTLQ